MPGADHGTDEPAETETAVQLADESADADSGRTAGYPAVMIAVLAIGLVGVVGGTAGLYVIFTGGTADTPELVSLGEFDCEEFNGDPQVVHSADYEIATETQSPTELSAFDGSVDDGVTTVVATTDGELLGASANEVDGTRIDVETNESRVTVEREGTAPFRLWIDAISDDADVTRMQLDICPPAAG